MGLVPVAVALVVAVGIGPLSACVSPSPGWSATAPMRKARSEHTATLLNDGRVLVTGGLGPAGPRAAAERYDPATGSWTATVPMAQSRAEHTATLLADGTVLVTAGLRLNSDGTWTETATAELYDPATATWAPTGSLGAPRGGHTATRLADGRVLVAGGENAASRQEGFAMASAELYDPAVGTWSPTASLGTGRSLHTATLLGDGRVLVAGGQGGTLPTHTDEPMAPPEIYVPAKGIWKPTGDSAERRMYHTATLLADGRVLMVGGFTGPLNGLTAPTASAELFDPAAVDPTSGRRGRWTVGSPLPQPRGLHTAAVVGAGKVLVAGGLRSADETSAKTFLYRPTSGTWIAAGPLPSPGRTAATATALSPSNCGSPCGAVLFTGGGLDRFGLPPEALADVYRRN